MATVSAFRYDNSVRNTAGQAIAGASVAVLSEPANTTTQPGSPLIALYGGPLSNQAVAITSASWLAGFITFNFTATPPSDVIAGNYLAASGFNPTGFNGVWLITSVVGNAVTVTTPYSQVAIANPGTFVSAGTVNTSALPNPLESDQLGNFYFYAPAGIVTVQIYSSLLPQQLVLLDQNIVAGGGAGSVTSVALTMPTEFSVAGSPITGAGTLAVTKANENANQVFAGPTSGGAAAPGFRALVAADLPAGTGTVTSVALTVAVPSFMGEVVTGSPLTTSGTLAVTLTFNNQNANTFLAGPASGAASAPAFRAISSNDLPFTSTALSSANILALDGTPITLVPAPGVGFTIVPYLIVIKVFGGSVAYTDAGGAVQLNVGSATFSLASNAVFTTPTSPNKQIQRINGIAATDTAGNPPTDDNAPLTISKLTNNFAAGNGTATIIVYYLIVPTT